MPVAPRNRRCRAAGAAPGGEATQSLRGELVCQEPRVPCQVHIAAADDDAHALALQQLGVVILARERLGARKGEGARGLDDDLHALGKKTHGFYQLLVADGDDVFRMVANDGEGELAQRLGLRAVGNGLGVTDAHDMSGAQRLLCVVGGFGLDANYLAVWRHGLGRQQAARQQAAAAQADEQVVQVGHLLQQLQRGGALACDDVGVVERGYQRHAALARQLAADGLAVFGVAVVCDHLGAVFARGGHLGVCGVFGHHHQGGHVQQPRR